MNKTAQNQYNSLMEAYYAVYDDDIRNKLNEEKEIKEFLEVIDFLIEDGYDLSEYTYEELYEYHITERWGALLKGVGSLARKAGSAFYQGAKGPAKELIKKAGKLAVPTALAAGADQYFTGGWFRDRIGDANRGLRQLGHSLPTPGQAADSIKPYIAAPDISKPSPPKPPKRNLPPAHLTQGYSYGKNNIITEDPAFPSQKPKAGDWAKLTIDGITKLWDPETNSYQLPGTINKRLRSQGEKEITVPGKAPKPSASTPEPEEPKPSASTPAPTPSRSSSSATASTADKIKGGMDVYNKQRSSGDFKGATETGRNISALKYGSPEERKAKTIGTSNPLMNKTFGYQTGNSPKEQQSRANAIVNSGKVAALKPKPEVQSKSNLPGGSYSPSASSMMSQRARNILGTQSTSPTPKPSPTRNGFGVPTAPLAAKLSAATLTAPPTPISTPKPSTPTAAPKPPTRPLSAADQRQGIRASYEYDAYDLVLEYLLSQGHADTLEEANYVMLEMDAETIGDIVEVMGKVPSVIQSPPKNDPKPSKDKKVPQETGVTGDGKGEPMDY